MTYRNGTWERTQDRLSAADQKYAARPTRVAYRPTEGPSGPWLGTLAAEPIGSYGPEPTFRRQVPPRRFPIVQYQVNGLFDGEQIAEAFSGRGNWLPEDTYRPPHAVLRYDEGGGRVTATPLRPTANPLGYLLDPPRALTTIRAARALLGDEPISAIRVRVRGVEDPGEEAWTRVENVARRIAALTGLRPIVTLGASPARVLVHVPGISVADQPPVQSWRLPNFASETLSGRGRYASSTPSRSVRGFGWVEEPWLREGAAISYLRSGAAQHGWLVLLLVASSTIYLVAAFASLALHDTKTNAIRRAVGWQRGEIFRLELSRASWLGATGAVLGTVGGLMA
ncbi:MAG TPA: hypothetical protein VFP10_06850, partial [Candidatus Eisenbacteria bacterium]|nr:hypothetical protein [Candidatus Eisenbacteria bacterium]